jgi:hypothetical protein
MGNPADHHLRGILLSGAGMLLMGPDSLLLRLVTTAGPAETTFYRTLFLGLSLCCCLV